MSETAAAHTVDRQLVARMATGDESALATLYDRHGMTAYSVAYAILGDAADADEAVADAFLQAWTQAAAFEAGRASVAGWLCMIVRSRALDRLRSRRRRARTLELAAASEDEGIALPLAPGGPDPDRAAEQRELGRRVRGALDDLPEAQRRVLELAYFGGLSQSEIALELGEPLGTIKTRTRAAMEKLRTALVAYGVTG